MLIEKQTDRIKCKKYVYILYKDFTTLNCLDIVSNSKHIQHLNNTLRALSRNLKLICTISKLKTSYASISKLKTRYASTSKLNISYASTSKLNTSYASISMLNTCYASTSGMAQAVATKSWQEKFKIG